MLGECKCSNTIYTKLQLIALLRLAAFWVMPVKVRISGDQEIEIG